MENPVFLVIALSMIFGLTSCSLFDNNQMPECLKTKKGEDSPGIVTCSNPLFFNRPDWHPEGEWIATEHADSLDTNSDGNKDTWFVGIWLVHAETGQTQPLLPFGGAPDWNPAGTHLAVHSRGGIYTVEITSLAPARYDTSSVILLTDFDAPAFYPTWSGDGKWIAFDTSYEHENGAYLVWKVKNDGTELKKVSVREFGGGRQPNWCKSNDKIIYTSYEMGGAEGPEVFSMNVDGSGSKQLTKNGENYHPKFSPDSRKIIYEHWDGIDKSIRVMDSDGSGKNVLAKDWSSDMAWSPDGKKIVYVFSNQYYDRPGNGQLWMMNNDGSNKKQLTKFE